jgi:two-component system sensor kinase FixL
MHWVSIIWSAGAGACLMLALLNALVWIKDRKAWTSLILALMACGVAGHALMELGMMSTRDPLIFGRFLYWSHLYSFTVIACSILFVRLYLGTGRNWLAALVIGWRLVALVLNFFFCEVNINYTEIRSLNQVAFLGEEVSIVAEADINRLMWLAQTALPLWLLFVVDATVTRWKQKDQPFRGVVVGGCMALFILLAITQAVLSLNGLIATPMLPSIAFGFMTLAMGYELSRDVLRASQLTSELRNSEQRLRLAATAAHVVLWEWSAGQDKIWASSGAREFYDLPEDQPLSFEHFKKSLHPDDRERVLTVINEAVKCGGSFSTEYRRVYSDGRVRRMAGSGSAERDPITGTTLLRGVSVDVTESHEAKQTLRAQREQLNHTLRLATMSQMASSLAHELNQPLTAIVNNANAARRMMAKETASQQDLVEIFEDIAADGQRAGGVIRGIRTLARHEEQERMEISFEQVVGELLPLITAEARARGVEVVVEMDSPLPMLWGNSVQIQQILLNLTMNAMDALEAPEFIQRKVILRAEVEAASALVMSVRDFGMGLTTEVAEHLFEPFFTTKENGLGMGLAIVKSLVEAHGGYITAANADGGGVCFQIWLPANPMPV